MNAWGSLRDCPLNKLQDLTAGQYYFVTLDPPGPVDPATVIAEFDYTHPVIDMALRERQSVIYGANEGTRVKLAGSCFHSKQLGPDLIGSTRPRSPPGRTRRPNC